MDHTVYAAVRRVGGSLDQPLVYYNSGNGCFPCNYVKPTSK